MVFLDFDVGCDRHLVPNQRVGPDVPEADLETSSPSGCAALWLMATGRNVFDTKLA
jgi:hypothetical protein